MIDAPGYAAHEDDHFEFAFESFGRCDVSEDLKAVVRLAEERGIWVLSDECYVYLNYTGEHFSVGSLREYRERMVIIGSLSKTYAMTGWRLGYALGPAAVIAAMQKLQSQSTSNPTSIVQKAAVAALNGPQDASRRCASEYIKLRDHVVKGLRAIPGVKCTHAGGRVLCLSEHFGVHRTRAESSRLPTSPAGCCVRLMWRRSPARVLAPASTFGSRTPTSCNRTGSRAGAHAQVSCRACRSNRRAEIPRVAGFAASVFPPHERTLSILDAACFDPRPWGTLDLSPIYPNHKFEEKIGEAWLTGDACKVANGPLKGQDARRAELRSMDLNWWAMRLPIPNRFPLLLKFLFPHEKLSVQVHPDDAGGPRVGQPCGKDRMLVCGARPARRADRAGTQARGHPRTIRSSRFRINAPKNC